MLKKTLTFENLEGVEITSDFYFNLNAAELTELEVEFQTGMSEHIRDVVKRDDRKELMNLFKLLIRKSIGTKHEDGLRFIKSEEISDGFTQTDAYGQLILELSSSPDAAANFFMGVLPRKVLEKLSEESTDEGPKKTADEWPKKPAWILEQREPTESELINMTRDEMVLAYRVKNAKDPMAELEKLLAA